MHKFIKKTHHLTNLGEAEEEPRPRSLQRVAKWLGAVVVPAAPTPTTGWKLYGSARRWLDETLGILRVHYGSIREEVRARLGRMDLEEGDRALEVAVRWSRRNLRNIQERTVREAMVEARGVQVLGSTVARKAQDPGDVTQKKLEIGSGRAVLLVRQNVRGGNQELNPHKDVGAPARESPYEAVPVESSDLAAGRGEASGSRPGSDKGYAFPVLSKFIEWAVFISLGKLCPIYEWAQLSYTGHWKVAEPVALR
ncbi:hypothetical protein DPX16_4316 [Anabarilius grahami]|uniref:Uncharacterized protein n=1 Tax=Anabarilius grahami TaxID=495550 RepID=A0A3N0YDE8_ANAGA|nr:hypothetical protein DPX16_4316 [Anabarilius grahami]